MQLNPFGLLLPVPDMVVTNKLALNAVENESKRRWFTAANALRYIPVGSPYAELKEMMKLNGEWLDFEEELTGEVYVSCHYLFSINGTVLMEVLK